MEDLNIPAGAKQTASATYCATPVREEEGEILRGILDSYGLGRWPVSFYPLTFRGAQRLRGG